MSDHQGRGQTAKLIKRLRMEAAMAQDEFDRLADHIDLLEAKSERLREAASRLCEAVTNQKSLGVAAISPRTAAAVTEVRAALAKDGGGDA